jgi:hypothetical protein
MPALSELPTCLSGADLSAGRQFRQEADARQGPIGISA